MMSRHPAGRCATIYDVSVVRRTRSVAPWGTAIVSMAVLLAACAPGQTTTTAAGNGPQPAATPDTARPAVTSPPRLEVSPPDMARDVRPDTPVLVAAQAGELTSTRVVDDGGASVAGSLSADRRRWTASAPLHPSHQYTIDAQAEGPAGATTLHTTFATVRAIPLKATLTPSDGDVVGIGMPIILRLDHPVVEAQQVAFISHLTVTSTSPVAGAWHWWSLEEVHYRPETFWSPGTTVTVKASLADVDAGAGVWGTTNLQRRFSVGESHSSVIDNAAHTISVSAAGQVRYTWPASMGKPGFETIGGTLWVPYKQQKVRMQSCGTFGGAACVPGNANFYDQDVFWDTAVSTDGYFIHAAPWSVGSQGRANVSHGCINLSPENAKTFFEMSIPGDVVQVVNSPKTADQSDGEGDWQIPFARYGNSGPAKP